MSDILQERNAPQNMVNAYKTLQALYGEQNTPLVLGTSTKGAATNMLQIEVGTDQMMLCILANYHGVPKKYTDSAPFFVLGHEFGHIIAHPGKDTLYWKEAGKMLPVERYQQGKWLNAISDILVNWTVTTATGVTPSAIAQQESVKRQMIDGWKASQFNRACTTKKGYALHRKLLRESQKGIPLKDNRYQPKGGLPGQYDNAATDNKYEPTAETPFYQKHTGHGRGDQYYPPINYCLAENMGDAWVTVKMLKTQGSLKLGKKYVVQEARTYDGRKSKELEPIAKYKINGEWVAARYCQTCCPQCGEPAKNTWDNWWDYVPRADAEAFAEEQGTWVYLLIQMFAMEWAMAYSCLMPYGSMPLDRYTGEKWLEDVSDDMDAVMRGH